MTELPLKMWLYSTQRERETEQAVLFIPPHNLRKKKTKAQGLKGLFAEAAAILILNDKCEEVHCRAVPWSSG